MAQLQFTITNQTISRIDKFAVVAMSQNYLYARFAFLTDDWAEVGDATAVFTSPCLGTYKVVLDENGECLVPWEVLQKPGVIGVSVYGGDRITANVAEVAVGETGYRDSAANETEPTADVLDQLYQRIIDYVDAHQGSGEGQDESQGSGDHTGENYMTQEEVVEIVDYHISRVDEIIVKTAERYLNMALPIIKYRSGNSIVMSTSEIQDILVHPPASIRLVVDGEYVPYYHTGGTSGAQGVLHYLSPANEKLDVSRDMITVWDADGNVYRYVPSHDRSYYGLP